SHFVIAVLHHPRIRALQPHAPPHHVVARSHRIARTVDDIKNLPHGVIGIACACQHSLICVASSYHDSVASSVESALSDVPLRVPCAFNLLVIPHQESN